MLSKDASVNLIDVFIDIYSTLFKIVSYRTGTVHVAQDITQDIYFKIFKVANEFPAYEDARNYLIRVALNASSDYRRTEQRRVQILNAALHMFENYSPSPEDNHYSIEKINLLDSTLSTLPEKCREILYLSRVDGLTHKEIAQKMGISVSLVEKYAVRTLLHCRDTLKNPENKLK
ncbi:RNA polymerase subunit sigma-70 [Citrobacter freundii complex sp. CFNIH2]|uniref:RNA polymerase sigma factor n=1 Tax=Citrobacter freundii complex sp. CFNIH2 TaxID=2066049 RepID=UPI000C86ACE0|nr:RNA polymerase sigma factor [Citrobacter freundii complex sp. CFNIH2]AUO66008.1 RNA polymerase subunit sigma-70 [Citrobacter freundii complex sp. CFNIH2]